MSKLIEKLAVQSLVEYEGELIFGKEKFTELIIKYILEKMEKEIEHAYEVSDISTAATLQALSLDILNDFDMEISDDC